MSTDSFVYILEMSWRYACALHKNMQRILNFLLWLWIKNNFRN